MRTKAPKPKQSPTTKGTSGLTVAQEQFVRAFVVSRDGTDAAIKAGYSRATAPQAASRLLKHVQVRAAIEHATEAATKKIAAGLEITLERTLLEIAKGAFHDPRKFFDAGGQLKAIPDLDDDTAAALAGFDVTEEFSSEGGHRKVVGFTKKVKLGDRKGYLDMLMKHLGAYKEDNKQKAQPLAEAIQGLMSELHQSSAGRLTFAAKKSAA